MQPLIYLFEDDASLAELFAEVVHDEFGSDVVRHTSIGALRERSVARRPDLIVADFWGQSHLRLSEPERAEIAQLGGIAPLVLVSGRAWAHDLAGEELGVSALLPKPLEMDSLVRVVRTALGACGVAPT